MKTKGITKTTKTTKTTQTATNKELSAGLAEMTETTKMTKTTGTMGSQTTGLEISECLAPKNGINGIDEAGPPHSLKTLIGGAQSAVKNSRSTIWNNPETPQKRSQSKFWISSFSMAGDPQALEKKAYSLPRLVSEFCYPQYGWCRFLLSRAPSMEQPELVVRFLS